MDREEIIEKVKREKIEFIDLMFSDLSGHLKSARETCIWRVVETTK